MNTGPGWITVLGRFLPVIFTNVESFVFTACQCTWRISIKCIKEISSGKSRVKYLILFDILLI